MKTIVKILLLVAVLITGNRTAWADVVYLPAPFKNILSVGRIFSQSYLGYSSSGFIVTPPEEKILKGNISEMKIVSSGIEHHLFFDRNKRIILNKFKFEDSLGLILSDEITLYKYEESEPYPTVMNFVDNLDNQRINTIYDRDENGNIIKIKGNFYVRITKENGGYIYTFIQTSPNYLELNQYWKNGRKLIEIGPNGSLNSWEYEFREDGKIKKITEYYKESEDDEKRISRIHEYDHFGDLSKQKNFYGTTNDTWIFINYVHDSKGNWIKRSMFLLDDNNKIDHRNTSEQLRFIEYYE